MYPKPDRSDHEPNFTKTDENEVIDIGWSDGELSDGRPYRTECWAESHITMMTFFFSTAGLESRSERQLQELLASEGLVRFLSDEKHLCAKKITDAGGNDMWSVNVVIGTEEELLAKTHLHLRPYGPAAR